MIRNLLCLSLALISGNILAELCSVRTALSQYTNIVRRSAMRVETIRNVGVSNTSGAQYQELCRAVSNETDSVFRNMSQITTNAAERLVLMSTGWQYSEDYYLNVYDILADMAMSNLVTRAELEWYGMPDRNDLSNCIRCRYREPRVMNLAHSIYVVTADTNWYQSVVSGISYTNYLEEVSAGIWE